MEVKSGYDPESVDCSLSYLIELLTILGEFRQNIVIVGGWVPYLLYNNPDDQHTGSIDIDLALDFNKITNNTYATILSVLSRHGFTQGKQPYIFKKEAVTNSGVPVVIELDLLAEMYGGTTKARRHQRVQDIEARKLKGVDLAFQEAVVAKVSGRLPDGAVNEVKVNVAGAVPFLVMKGMAIWDRADRKDAYDIYYVVNNYPSGIDSLIKAFEPHKDKDLVKEGLGKIRSKFRSPEHVGPTWVAQFLEIDDADEVERIKRDVFEKITHLIDKLDICEYEGN